MMNVKLRQQMFQPCRMNGLIKTILTIPHDTTYMLLSPTVENGSIRINQDKH